MARFKRYKSRFSRSKRRKVKKYYYVRRGGLQL